jgi:hypothetical protein
VVVTRGPPVSPPRCRRCRADSAAEGGQVLEPLLEVEGGRHGAGPHAQPHHGVRHVRLDAHDHGQRAAQPRHLRDGPQGLGAEAVEDVERRDVDDDAAGPVLADLADEVVLEPDQLGVVQRGVDGRHERPSLPQDGDESRSGVHEPEVTALRVTV